MANEAVNVDVLTKQPCSP